MRLGPVLLPLRAAVWTALCAILFWNNTVSGQQEGAEFRIVGLVPVRNEERRLPFCLRALSLFTDAIVVLDDASDDNTVAVTQSLAEECRIERILTKDGKWERDETADRNRMLAEGRAIGGTHFVVLDADEAFTGNLADGDELRTQILGLHVGQSIALHWIQLWKSGRYWRTDRLYDGDGSLRGLLGSMAMACIFRDDGTSIYEGEFIHTRRMPEALANHSVLLTDLEVGLMHFQFVNWRNFILKQFVNGENFVLKEAKAALCPIHLYPEIKCKNRSLLWCRKDASLAVTGLMGMWLDELDVDDVGVLAVLVSGLLLVVGQAWYKCFEKVRLPDKDDGEIYVRYSGSLDTIGQRAAAVNPTWFARYEEFYREEDMLQMDLWRVPMMQAWFENYGHRHFEAVGALDMLRPYPELVPGIPEAKQADRSSVIASDRKHVLSFIMLPASAATTRCVINSLVSALEGVDASLVQVILCVCNQQEQSAMDGLPSGITLVTVDCGNAGQAVNTAISVSVGSVVALVEGCVRLPWRWVESVLGWYAPDASLSGPIHASKLRPTLLSFPEEGLLSSRDEALCGGLSAHPEASAQASEENQPYLPLYPQDAGDEFKPHWRFAGAVVAIPWSTLQATNGFPGDPAITFHAQLEHFKDRAAIYKHETWLAPLSLLVQRVFGSQACALAEIPDEAVQQDGPGLPFPQDLSIVLLNDLRDRRRSTLAKDGIVQLV